MLSSSKDGMMLPTAIEPDFATEQMFGTAGVADGHRRLISRRNSMKLRKKENETEILVALLAVVLSTRFRYYPRKLEMGFFVFRAFLRRGFKK